MATDKWRMFGFADAEEFQDADFSPQEILDWLGDPTNASNPEIFSSSLPEGVRYISGPGGLNCIDYATGSRGWRTINVLPSECHREGKLDDLVVYFNEAGMVVHMGRFKKEGKVVSQWNIGGAVFEHGLEQVPKGCRGVTIGFLEGSKIGIE